MRKGERKE
jgi:hypothetical protein